MTVRTAVALIAAPVLLTAQTNVDQRDGGSAAAGARPLAGIFAKPAVDQFRAGVTAASSFQIFRGVPKSRTAGPDDQGLIQVGDVRFFPDPVPVSATDKAAIDDMFREGRAFAPGGDGSPCATFYPTFLLVWKDAGSNTWQAELGMNCQEVRATGPGIRLHRYIPPASYGVLLRILGDGTAGKPAG